MRQSAFERPRDNVDVPALLDALGIDDTRRTGRTIEARCPSHPDKSPSWSIVDDPHSARNGMHYCFSCQFGGGPAALVRQVKDCTWEEAFEFLKGAPARELPLEVDVLVSSAPRVGRGMRVPHDVKVRPFEEWPTAPKRYLEERGITAGQVSLFDIGYALEGRLRGRVVLPMKNREGTVESYTARDFTGQPTNGKRYLEPEPNEGAIKSSLFGEHTWRAHESSRGMNRGVLIVLEGPFDALAVHSVVASWTDEWRFDVTALHGSRLHAVQAVKFSRYPFVIVGTDADPAGDAVAEDIQESLGRYSSVVRARPPVGHDFASLAPDDRIRIIRHSMGL